MYALNRQISEIVDICYDEMGSLQASLAQIERIQAMIGTLNSTSRSPHPPSTTNTYYTEGTKSPGNTKQMSNSDWPPQPPEGAKPNLNDPGAAEWRYQRYKYDQYQAGKQQGDILPFEIWKDRYFNPAAQGGRPGRPGGSDQVAARQALASEGFRNVENVELGGRYPDMVRYNADGSTDYLEVGEMLQSGMPEARERAKIADEILALGETDTVAFVSKMDITRRITYRRGDDVETKTLGNQ
ncbi:hypothetical protein [Kamptonema formosum]|uniref:hypothetical protein n=1 Tax=Kamptonema formosum TaxID=331992 RepID=UPI00034AF391|nr:hypothetical protein [Oscillatoria sp. PCC 10802]